MRGKELYESHCTVCHGLAGTGGRGPNLVETRSRLGDSEVARIIRVGVSGAGMPPFETSMNEKQVLEVVAYMGSFRQQEPVRGDSRHGEELFRVKGHCLTCHDSQRDGGNIGPDLTGVGRHRGQAYLRHKLVDPQNEVLEPYQPIRVTTTTGASFTGTILNEDTFSLQIRDLNGSVHSFQKSDLTEHEVQQHKSLMPSYRSVFNDAELDDLVA
jgi:putative heme-binding domain-containing protein